MSEINKIVFAEGHLIDSGLMRQMFDVIISDGGSFEIMNFDIGKTNDEVSSVKISIKATEITAMNVILLKLSSLGCTIDKLEDARTEPSPSDGVVPSDFYSTTNHQTEIFLDNSWVKVDKLRMDGVIVVPKDKKSASVKKFRDVLENEEIVVGLSGVKVQPEFAERDRSDFTFMAGDVSSERKVQLAVDKVAQLIGGKNKNVAVVAGPVVIHTGAGTDLANLISAGYIQALCAGNALAVHDIESVLFETSLGIDSNSGKPVEMGHRNHLRAINEVRRAGSIKNLVNEGKLNSGVMHSVIRAGIPFSLAGSLRDDGPLPETITDMNLAQEDHMQILEDIEIVIMLSSMLHSIAVGNMIPASVLTICVDINPAVVTKLKDRGSMQTIGLVTDVGLFLKLLSQKLLSQ